MVVGLGSLFAIPIAFSSSHAGTCLTLVLNLYMINCMSISKEAKKAYNAKYYAKHRSDFLARSKQYRKEHPEQMQQVRRSNYVRNRTARLAYRKTYYEANTEKAKSCDRAGRLWLKALVIEAYGGKCSCCGEPRLEFLTIEHSRHDGAAHRKRVGAGKGMYRDLRNRDFPKDEGLTIFCWNCQMATRYGDRCPHEDKSIRARSIKAESSLASC